MRLAAERRRDDEADHAGQQEWLPPEEVAQLAGDRHHDRRGDQVGRNDPGVVIEAVQLGHDPRHRGPDDRLVERGQEECQHRPRDHPDGRPARQALCQMTAGVDGATRRRLRIVCHALFSVTLLPVMFSISCKQA